MPIADGMRAALGLAPSGPHHLFYRHTWPVRIAHWVGAFALLVMLLSGLNIFNTHPALYTGQNSDFDHPAFAISVVRDDAGYGVKGVTSILGHSYDTTGWLGLSRVNGVLATRGFPSWATLPGWATTARKIHFTFAWILVIDGVLFFLYGLISRHFARDLAPTAGDFRRLPAEIAGHARLRFVHSRHYNGLQKLTYCLVLFVLAPLIVLTGLTMSPMMDAAFPVLPWMFGGRQTARSIHFLCAFSFVLFVIVHIAMVMLSGSWNNLRSMLTGWYAIRKEARDG